MTYCSVNRVRLVSGLESHDISDAKIRNLRDEVATTELNEDINQQVEDEIVNRQISREKENNVDGENTTFYLRELHKNELSLGDRTGNGRGTVDDVDLYFLNQDDERINSLQVSLEDREIGKLDVRFSDGSELDDGDLYASYSKAPLDEDGYVNNDFDADGPDRLVETACAQLTAAYAFTNIEASKLKDFSIGNVTINSQSEGARIMRENYMDTRKRITQSQVIQSGEIRNTVNGAFTGGLY